MSKSTMIRDMYASDDNVTVAEVAETVGVRYQFAYNVIRRYCDKIGTDVRKANPVTQSSRIRELFLAGKKPGEIAKELNTNYSFVHQVVKKLRDELGLNNDEQEGSQEVG